MKCKLLIVILILITFTTNTFASNLYPLYAEIKKAADNKYYFTHITSEMPSGLSMDLDTNRPKGFGGAYKCNRFLLGLFGCSSDQEKFRTLSFSGSDTFGLWMTSLFGLFYLFPLGYNDQFDSKAFDNAITEAKLNGKIDTDKLVVKYNEIIKDAEAKNSLEGEKVTNYLNDIYNKYKSIYSDYAASISLKPIVEDNSGFYNNKISMMTLVKVSTNEIPQKKYYSADLKKSISAYPTNIVDAVDNLKPKLDNELNLQKNSNVELQTTYNNELKAITSYYPLIFINTHEIDNYNIEIKAPERIGYIEGKRQTIPINFIVKSRNFSKIFPNYRNEDNNINIVFENNSLSVYNKTKNFVEIKSISVYYNSKISNNIYEAALELPPESHKKGINIESIADSALLAQASYPLLTASKAKNSNLTFGFAVKYRVVEQNVDKTLYSAPSFNLYKVVNQRI